MEITINKTRVSLIQGDITRQRTEAIVNAANSSLMSGGGVDGAIHKAGGPAILAACKKIVAAQGPLPAGKAVITTGGNLHAKYVIHTVGPVWHGGQHDEEKVLAGAYRESLKLAAEHNISTIAFPSISTGAYGYPVDEAAEVAIQAVISFFRDGTGTLIEVVFVLFNKETYEAYQKALQHRS